MNTRIRELCARLDSERTEPVAFICECGCLTFRGEVAYVPLTPAAYDALGGAPLYAPGHGISPPV